MASSWRPGCVPVLFSSEDRADAAVGQAPAWGAGGPAGRCGTGTGALRTTGRSWRSGTGGRDSRTGRDVALPEKRAGKLRFWKARDRATGRLLDRELAGS